ncbi:MAG: DUF4012 domain-containing protein [Candidatus Moraniibacteriota bacterium]
MSKKIEKFVVIFVAISLVCSVVYFIWSNQKDSENKSQSSSALAKLVKEVITGEKVFLVLFQNNMELRPGGGFIGSFAVIKTSGGKVTSYAVHDTANFDGRIPENNDLPAPMKKIFKINAWKLRDSNFSPDYPTSAKKALDFYYQGGGSEKFDGVIAINASVLEKILQTTGPIRLEGYPNIFEAESALLTLEKQVEIDFAAQGIEVGERKDVMNDFLKEVLKKTVLLSKLDKLKLSKNLLGELKNKNIQIYFGEERLQKLSESSGADGAMDTAWSNDYLMVVDANLGSYKSDYYVQRALDYSVDFTKEVPEATLKITYNHTGKEKNWMTRDYLTYLRLYLPKNSRVNEISQGSEVTYGEELGKKFMGGFIEVPIGKTKTVEIKYVLPRDLKEKDYQLKIQKQSGSGVVPTKVEVKLSSGEVKNFNLELNGDTILK